MYNALSKYYDLFMRDTDYRKWADFVCGFLPQGADGVDLACGSGLFTIELKRRGFKIYGVDISSEMLENAVRNAYKSRLKIDFVKGDMASFKFIRQPEFVTAICDGVNYLKQPLSAFKNIYSALKQDGVFVFDISSEYKLKSVLANCTFSDTQDDITYIWRSTLGKKEDCLIHELTFFEKTGDLYKRSCENQIQYIHTTTQIKALLNESGFEDVQVYTEGTKGMKKEISESDERIFFMAKKH